MKNTRDSGFTLIELMVVCTIITIVTATVVPSFRMALVRNRMQTAAMEIVRGVYTAHGMASNNAVCHRLCIHADDSVDEGGTGGWVELARYGLNENSSCSLGTCTDNVNWQVLNFSLVGTPASPVNDSAGRQHTKGEAGNDISIAIFYRRQGNNWVDSGAHDLCLYFDPSGETRVAYGSPGTLCSFGDGVISIQPRNADGTLNGPVRHLRFTSGGSIRFTFIPGLN